MDWEQRVDDADWLRKQRSSAHVKISGWRNRKWARCWLRYEQCALHHVNAHRDLGAGQSQLFHCCCRRAAAQTREMGEPILWDFGSAARHHQLYCPWLGDRSGAAVTLLLRGDARRSMGRAEDVAKKIKIELEMRGLHKEPVGIDVIEPPVLFAPQREGITVVDGQQLMSDARAIKTEDEITLLNTPAMMVDAAYDELYRAMKPGMSRTNAYGLASKVLYDPRLGTRRGDNAILRERCNPHPHVFSDRVLRLRAIHAYFDILHSHMGYRTFTTGRFRSVTPLARSGGRV